MKKVKVLLVEDNNMARMVAEMNLKNIQCEVDSVSTGTAALECANSKEYDMILMDIGLGDETDGFIVTQDIRNSSKFNKITPIVALTAHNESSFHQKAKDVGMNDYLTKPLESSQLREVIGRLVGLKK